MSSKQAKILKETLLLINRDLNRNYKKILKNIPLLVANHYAEKEGFLKVQDFVNNILNEAYEFSQIENYNNFYDIIYFEQMRINSVKYRLKYNFGGVDNKVKNEFKTVTNFFTSKYQNLVEQGETIKEMRKVWQSGESEDKAVSKLKTIFEDSNKRALKYAKTTILTNNAKIKNNANLRFFNKQNIKTYKFDALLDNLTTDTCQELDGKKYNVKKAIAQKEKINNKLSKIINNNNLQDWEKYNEAIQFLNNNDAFAFKNNLTGNWETKIILRTKNPEVQGEKITKEFKHLKDVSGNNLPVPPLHYNCRSEIVAV